MRWLYVIGAIFALAILLSFTRTESYDQEPSLNPMNFDSGLGSLTTNDFSGGDTGYIRGMANEGEMRQTNSGLTGVSDLYGEEDDYGGYGSGMGLTW